MSVVTPTYKPDQVMEPRDSFATELNGERFVMVPNRDRLTADHPLVQAHPHLFRPVEGDLRYETEAATDNPGESRRRQRPVPSTKE